jgi:hypothetical protein
MAAARQEYRGKIRRRVSNSLTEKEKAVKAQKRGVAAEARNLQQRLFSFHIVSAAEMVYEPNGKHSLSRRNPKRLDFSRCCCRWHSSIK